MSLTCIRRIQVTSYTSFNQLLVLLYQGAEKAGDTYDLTHLKHDWYDKVGLNLKKNVFEEEWSVGPKHFFLFVNVPLIPVCNVSDVFSKFVR